jgi:hypothetical protein
VSAHHENDPDYNSSERAAETVDSSSSEIRAAFSAALSEARVVAAAGVDRVRDAYARNPTRTITLGVLGLAGLLALISTLTRRT